MASVIHLDTHVVVWLYGGQLEKLSSSAAKMINEHSLRISPMTFLELQYLYEIGRVTKTAQEVVGELRGLIELEISEVSFLSVAYEAVKLSWTRDPFDRFIVANALVDQAPLLTADKHIQEQVTFAVW